MEVPGASESLVGHAAAVNRGRLAVSQLSSRAAVFSDEVLRLILRVPQVPPPLPDSPPEEAPYPDPDEVPKAPEESPDPEPVPA